MYNFNHWLDRRNNKINENWFTDLFRGKKKQPPPSAPQNDPDEVQKAMNTPLVKKYTQIVLDHLDLEAGTKLQPRFYQALQRFVAAHITDNVDDKSYLRISQHDAILIINTLDHLQRPGEDQSIAEEMGITDPEALSNWIQTKLPTSQNAILQKGFGKDSSSFSGVRGARKGNLAGHPALSNLVKAGEEVVSQGLGKMPQAKIGGGLHAALIRLNQELIKMGNNANALAPKPEPKQTDPNKVPLRADPPAV
jgi:hypothetical protein